MTMAQTLTPTRSPAQVAYVPDSIPLLVESIAELLAPDGFALLYNDAVTTLKTQRECRALLDTALHMHSLEWEDVHASLLPPGEALPHSDAYLIRIRRVGAGGAHGGEEAGMVGAMGGWLRGLGEALGCACSRPGKMAHARMTMSPTSASHLCDLPL